MEQPVRIFKCTCEGNKYKLAGQPNDKPTLKEKREYGEYIAAGCTVITIPVKQFREENWEWCPKHLMDIKKAIYQVTMAPSVKYWMVPEWAAETSKCAISGTPNSFVHSTSIGTTSQSRAKIKAHDISAYDSSGKIVGYLSVLTEGGPVGAFKILVREDAQKLGWAQKLLNEAERSGLDMISTAKVNSFTDSGRAAMIKWLKSKQ